MRKQISLLLSFAVFLFSANAALPDLDNAFGISVMAEANDDALLIPSGKSIGVTLSTDGVLVVSVAAVPSSRSTSSSPAHDAGIRPGDFIKKFNGKPVSNVEDLTAAIHASKGEKSSVTVQRDKKNMDLLITPKLSSADGNFKIGAWIKDAASGIGTMTYLNPSDSTFAALGHGICDPESGNIIPLDSGSILSSTIVAVEKGAKGSPGELKGVFAENGCVLGSINKNTSCGIFGKCKNEAVFDSTAAIPIADRNEIKPGKAFILTNVEGNITEQFEVEILKVMPQNTSASKDMIIKVTDETLLDKTGGIVQGMSGSPIIQNGKLIGAVTHVFVNDPTRGYGIFIENMLAEAEKIK